MNRFVFGRGWVFEEEANDGTTGGAGGGDGGAGGDAAGQTDGDAGAGGTDGGAAAAAEPSAAAGEQGGEKKEVAPKDMKAAIDAALGYTGKPKEQGEPGAQKPAAAKPAEKKPAAAEGTETETHHANGKPKKGEKGEDLDAEGKVVAKQPAKLKTAAELELKPDERKALGTKAQIRFGELVNTVKAHETARLKDAETIKTLAEARDTILGVLEETNTTQDELAGYLEFNALVKSSDPKNWDRALQIVENQRAALYKALGKEPAGGDIDLLADFPDLKKQVDEEEITRAAALEIAHGRRDKAARAAAAEHTRKQQDSKTQTAEQQKKDAEAALAGIEAWTLELQKNDLDYKAKESKLLGDTLTGVLKDYPPKLWLPTLKRLYAGITVEKASPAAGGHKPLRPSGGKVGDKQPTSMLEAINTGLGYAAAEKG